MFNHKLTVLIAATFTVAGLTACDPEAIEGTATPTESSSLLDPGVDGRWLDPTTEAPVPVDPYTTDGTWLVPGEIAPGTYRAASSDGRGTGYYAVCADFECDIDIDGSDFTGMIDNDFFSGSAVVTIPAHAVSIEMRGVALTPMG